MTYDITPVVRELSADGITPVMAFNALAGNSGDAFLFESVERGENLGRYSFVGFDPRRRLVFDPSTPSPAELLREELRPLSVANEESLPPFFGGAVGYFGYGVAGWTERIPDSHPDDRGIPDACLLFFDNVLVFDHVKQRLYVVANMFATDPQDADARIDRAIEKLRTAKVDLLPFPDDVPQSKFQCNFTRQ